MAALKQIEAPGVEPILLAEAKAHLRVDHSDDDALITALIIAVRQHLDAPTGLLERALIDQTWELVLDDFPDESGWSRGWHRRRDFRSAGTIKIPFPPLQSITSIKYFDGAGVEQTLDPSTYSVDAVGAPGRVIPKTSWPPTALDRLNTVTIRYVCGYGADGTKVPAVIRQAMLLLIGHFYENREQVVIAQSGGAIDLPLGVMSLLAPLRVFYL